MGQEWSGQKPAVIVDCETLAYGNSSYNNKSLLQPQNRSFFCLNFFKILSGETGIGFILDLLSDLLPYTSLSERRN